MGYLEIQPIYPWKSVRGEEGTNVNYSSSSDLSHSHWNFKTLEPQLNWRGVPGDMRLHLHLS